VTESPDTEFIAALPKAELHMHLEGALEPELLFELATRNDVALGWRTVDELRGAYEFHSLQPFLDLYYEGCRVLCQERDFYDLTRAYLARAHADGVRRAEISLGPQSFLGREFTVDDYFRGVLRAIDDAESADGISAGIIVTVQRHRSEQEAFEQLDAVLPWADRIAGFGLAAAEAGNPPSKFARYFAELHRQGFRTCAHAGEEGPADYVREAVEVLGVDRIDHGIHALDDPLLVKDLADAQVPITVCPLSNARLKVVPGLAQHPLPAMLAAGLNVSLNSDDPAYFGGYIGDNYAESARALGLSRADLETIAANSIRASFLPRREKDALLAALPGVGTSD
jgi:adenosine deaminase